MFVASEQTNFLGEGRTPCAVKQYIVFSWSLSHLRRSDEDLCFCNLVLEQILPNNYVSRQWDGAFPQLPHPGSWTALRKAGKNPFLSTEDLWVSPSAARVALGQLWAQEGNCEWSFKAPDLGRTLDTWFPEMTVLEISRSWAGYVSRRKAFLSVSDRAAGSQ